jgi:hypothetical protein
MPHIPLLDYVKATAALLDLPLDAAQALRVAAHLERTAGMAVLLDLCDLRPEDEPAEIFCPAPFVMSPHPAP